MAPKKTRKPSSMPRTGAAVAKPKTDAQRKKLLGTGAAGGAASAIMKRKAAIKKAAKGS